MQGSFDLDRSISMWRRQFAYAAKFSTDDIDELESGLRDRIDALRSGGISDRDAFEAAVRRMGSYGKAEAEYSKIFWAKVRHQRTLRSELARRWTLLAEYIRIAWRNLAKARVYSAISIGGLAVGLAGCLLILLFIQDELGYDRFHANADRIFRLQIGNTEQGTSRTLSPYPAAELLTSMVPGIVETVRLGQDPVQVTRGTASFREDRFFWTDPTVFDVFSFEIVSGDPSTALRRPGGIVLTERMAKKYFGDEEPVGQMLGVRIFDGQRTLVMEVAAVVRDVPFNSHLQFDFLASMATGISVYPTLEDDWSLSWVYTYALTSPAVPNPALSAELGEAADAFMNRSSSTNLALQLRPLTEIHLYGDDGTGGAISTVYMFGSVALLILLLACINFVNLTTARSTKRAREIGLRKALGADRRQIMGQFLGEAMVVVCVSFALAAGLSAALLGFFNQVAGRQFSADIFATPRVLFVVLAMIPVVGLLAGGYPALVLSRLGPIRTLTGGMTTGDGRAPLLRRALVVLQFCLSTLLIIGTVVIYMQMAFVRSMDLGFDNERLVVIPVDDRAVQANLETIKTRIAGLPGVVGVAGSSESLPSVMNFRFGVDWTSGGVPSTLAMYIVSVDFDFFPVIGSRFTAGRNFDESRGADGSAAYVLNEAAVKVMGLVDPVGTPIALGGRAGAVIGVVEDFHYGSVRNAIQPVVYFILTGTERYSPDNLILRVSGDDLPGSLADLKSVWSEFSAEQPFSYSFVDQGFDELYRNDRLVMRLFDAFAALAILIACLGLFGLAAYEAERRRKELGVRKVLGAKTAGLVGLLAREFALLVFVAIAPSVPLGYVFAGRWLETFVYRAHLGWVPFVVAGLVTTVLALLTVSYHVLKAGRADPVVSLRSE